MNVALLNGADQILICQFIRDRLPVFGDDRGEPAVSRRRHRRNFLVAGQVSAELFRTVRRSQNRDEQQRERGTWDPHSDASFQAGWTPNVRAAGTLCNQFLPGMVLPWCVAESQ